MKPVIFLSFLGFINSLLFAQPKISSFTPTSGLIGTTVIITGNNFSNITNENTVYFGAVKAVVTNASSSSLSVKVPVGASFQPITITTNGLTTSSKIPFSVKFGSTDTAYHLQSFALPIQFPTGLLPESCATGDFNNDGKVDIVACNEGSDFISVYKNRSTPGKLDMSPYLIVGSGMTPYRASVADIDGDGKLDLIIVNRNLNTISVLRNTTASDSISFASKIDFAAGNAPRNVTVADFDGDGKPDMAITANQSSILLFKNSSTPGSISFSTLPNLSTGSGAWGIASGDIDGDGKLDVALTLSTTGKLAFFRNTSTTGNISFAAKVEYNTSTSSSTPRGISLADLNNDGNLDAILSDNLDFAIGPVIKLSKNISTPGTIAFDTIRNYGLLSSSVHVSVENLDGDDKPDIPLTNASASQISVYKNNSQADIVSLAPYFYYPANGSIAQYLCTADIDGDAKPDMVVVNRGSNNIAIFKNRIGEVNRLCPNGSLSLSANFSGTAFQWQESIDSVNFTNISDGGIYSGCASSLLQINNVSPSLYGHQYRCLVDGNPSNLYSIQFTGIWTNGGGNNLWENPLNWSCNSLPDANTDVIINNGTVVLSSNVLVRSLRIDREANLTVNAGHSITTIR